MNDWTNLVRDRSNDHARAMRAIFKTKNFAVVFSILRLELDSLVRALYLLELPSRERILLAQQTLNGAERWRDVKNKIITDRAMLNAATKMIGWKQFVYRFGCSFVHLSILHSGTDHSLASKLNPEEQRIVKEYIKQYHSVEVSDQIWLSELYEVADQIFTKVHENMIYSLDALERLELGEVE